MTMVRKYFQKVFWEKYFQNRILMCIFKILFEHHFNMCYENIKKKVFCPSLWHTVILAWRYQSTGRMNGVERGFRHQRWLSSVSYVCLCSRPRSRASFVASHGSTELWWWQRAPLSAWLNWSCVVSNNWTLAIGSSCPYVIGYYCWQRAASNLESSNFTHTTIS